MTALKRVYDLIEDLYLRDKTVFNSSDYERFTEVM